jgi:hypothetical protein
VVNGGTAVDKELAGIGLACHGGAGSTDDQGVTPFVELLEHRQGGTELTVRVAGRVFQLRKNRKSNPYFWAV